MNHNRVKVLQKYENVIT